MKSIKFLSLSVLFIVFLFSSCSQARYSHLTRRVKSSKTENTAAVKTHQTKADKIVAIKTTDNQVTDEKRVEEETSGTATPELIATDSKKVEKSVTYSNSNVGNTKQSREFPNLIVPVKKQTKSIKKFVRNKIKKATKADGSEISGLLRLLLIIILVLLILQLVTSVFPAAFNWIFTIALILLILWLIQQLL